MKTRLLILLVCVIGALTAVAYWKSKNAVHVMKPMPDVQLDAPSAHAALKSNQPVQMKPNAREVMFEPGARFAFATGKDESVVVVVGEVKTGDDGSLTSIGIVEGQPESQAIFVMVGEAIAGSVDLTDGRTFTLNHVAPGIHRVSELDHEKGHDCAACRGEAKPVEADLKALPAGVRVAFDGNGGATTANASEARKALRLFALRAGPVKRGKQGWVGSKGESQASTKKVSKSGTTQNKTNSTGGATGQSKTNSTGGQAQSKTNSSGGTNQQGSGGSKQANGSTSTNNGGSSSGGTSIELMVLYTPGAAKIFGGEDGIKARIKVALEGTNKTFDNSQIAASVTLVHAGQVTYVSEGGKTKDLMNMSFNNHALRDVVRTLRKKHHADIVTMVTETDGGGVGFLLNEMKTRPELGFNVVCANSLHDSVLAHEVGHNLGCQHAAGDPQATGAMFDYAFGHRFDANDGSGSRQLRTVMAYAPGARVKYFSNPQVKLHGVPTGVAGKSDNAKVINQTVALVAKNSDK